MRLCVCLFVVPRLFCLSCLSACFRGLTSSVVGRVFTWIGWQEVAPRVIYTNKKENNKRIRDETFALQRVTQEVSGDDIV